MHLLLIQITSAGMQGLQPDANNAYQLTDPAISTTEDENNHYYGETDLGISAIIQFLSAHNCGPMCQQLCLPSSQETAERFLGLTQEESQHLSDLA